MLTTTRIQKVVLTISTTPGRTSSPACPFCPSSVCEVNCENAAIQVPVPRHCRPLFRRACRVRSAIRSSVDRERRPYLGGARGPHLCSSRRGGFVEGAGRRSAKPEAVVRLDDLR